MLGTYFGPFLEHWGLSKLQEHGHVIILSAFFWELVYMLAYRTYETIQPTFYRKLSTVKKLDWAMHRNMLSTDSKQTSRFCTLS